MATRYTLIEHIPVSARARGRAAFRASYPDNGAERVYVECDVKPGSLDPVWAEVIEDGIDALPEGETALSEVPGDALAPIVYPREDGDV